MLQEHLPDSRIFAQPFHVAGHRISGFFEDIFPRAGSPLRHIVDCVVPGHNHQRSQVDQAGALSFRLFRRTSSSVGDASTVATWILGKPFS